MRISTSLTIPCNDSGYYCVFATSVLSGEKIGADYKLLEY